MTDFYSESGGTQGGLLFRGRVDQAPWTLWIRPTRVINLRRAPFGKPIRNPTLDLQVNSGHISSWVRGAPCRVICNSLRLCVDRV